MLFTNVTTCSSELMDSSTSELYWTWTLTHDFQVPIWTLTPTDLQNHEFGSLVDALESTQISPLIVYTTQLYKVLKYVP